MAHNHAPPSGIENLKIAFLINVVFTCIELVGGLFTNSVAIISDALHDLGDSFSLGLAWLIEKKAAKEGPRDKYSFGYARFRLLGALINALVLIGGSIFIIIESIERFHNPEPVKSFWMMVLAIIGVSANGYAAWRTKGAQSLNEKVISWHLLEDVLGWVGVLIVAVILQFKDWYFLDPALSIGVTLFILYGVGKRLWETLHLLLQGVPKHIDLAKIESELVNLKHINSVHHTHVWSLDGEHHVFSTHLVVENIETYSQLDQVRQKALEALNNYHFVHHTIQVEIDRKSCPIY